MLLNPGFSSGLYASIDLRSICAADRIMKYQHLHFLFSLTTFADDVDMNKLNHICGAYHVCVQVFNAGTRVMGAAV